VRPVAAGVPPAVLGAAFLFNLGQGVLRPALPLYLARTFTASYTMVTLIPVVFGAGKWLANLPTGYLLDRLGPRLMIGGLALIAVIDVASVTTSRYGVFLGLRALGGVGWAMFATVATTLAVGGREASGRGRAVSRLLLSETCGLLLGSAAGGWLYQAAGAVSPFLFEAGCMLLAGLLVTRWAAGAPVAPPPAPPAPRRALRAALRERAVLLMGLTSAVLVAIQTGVLVFLFPLHVVQRAGLGPHAAGVLVSLGVLGRLLALWWGGSLSDRWGRARVLVPGLVAYAVCLGVLSRLTEPVALGLTSLATGAAAGVVAPIPAALVGDRVAPSLQGVAIGWLRTMSDGGHIVGPLLMGLLADSVDLSAPFLAGTVVLGLMAWPCRRHLDAGPSTATRGRARPPSGG
jgi:DHA1 family multidrug resistance protein-like MFS transporter